MFQLSLSKLNQNRLENRKPVLMSGFFYLRKLQMGASASPFNSEHDRVLQVLVQFFCSETENQ